MSTGDGRVGRQVCREVGPRLDVEPDPGEPDPGEPDPGEPDPGEPDPGEPGLGEARLGEAGAGEVRPGRGEGGRDDAAGCRPADEAAFREYVTARGPALLRIAVLLTGNQADAEDLLQAALAKTYLAWDKIRDHAALDAYVRRAMVNTQISWWRRRRVEEYPTDDIPDQAVADHAVAADLQDTVRRALDRLPQRMRAAVVLRYYEDMSEPEIADALGVSLGTVKSTVSRAVAKLRIDTELTGDFGGGPSAGNTRVQ
jgi:RNA polymerase sigma-70 factor (sigma-E family)